MTDRASQKPNGLLQFSGLTRTDANEGGAEEAGVEPTEDACAPSNGFEARAPHRERYSSIRQDRGLSRPRQSSRQYSRALSISCRRPPPASMLWMFAASSLTSCATVGRRAT